MSQIESQILFSKIEGEGPVILIMHGFLGMSDNWKTIGNKLSQNGFQVHLLDARNHGRSFHSVEFNYDVMVKDVEAYVQYHNIQMAYFLGHSMGGKVMMNFAIKFPDMVKKLIVADIGPKYYPPHHQQILEALNAVDFSIQPERSEVEEILKSYINDFAVRQFLMKSLFWKSPGQLDFRFNVSVFIKEIEEIGIALEKGNRFEGKTLFVRGADSNYILDSDWVGIQKYFPNARLETIQNAGHWLHAEQPEEFYNIVYDFLIH